MNPNLNQEHVKKIEEILSSKPVAIFMKGSPQFPMCGFSARACEVLKAAGVKSEDLAHFDVLSDRSLFETLKSWSNWPTSPQVYVKGQLVGGSDIVIEMYERGELQELIQQALAH